MRMTRPLLSWSLYDWASSPVPTLHTTFIFSVFFTTAVMPDGGTAAWAWRGKPEPMPPLAKLARAWRARSSGKAGSEGAVRTVRTRNVGG